MIKVLCSAADPSGIQRPVLSQYQGEVLLPRVHLTSHYLLCIDRQPNDKQCDTNRNELSPLIALSDAKPRKLV